MKQHLISVKEMDEAKRYKKKNGFWNPVQTPLSLACGMDPYFCYSVTSDLKQTTCLRCLSKRKACK